MKGVLSKKQRGLAIVLFAGVLVLVIMVGDSTFAKQENSETEALGEELERTEMQTWTIGGKPATAVCDAAIIENMEIDYSLRIDPGSLLQDESFVQELEETLGRLLDDATEDNVLYGQDRCYISACPVVTFDAANNCIANVVQTFLFTEDMEEAGTLMFYEVDGEVSYDLSFISASSGSGSIWSGLKGASDKKFILLANGEFSVLLSEDNELSGAAGALDDFTVSGDYYHALDYETLAVSYEDIVNEDNLILLNYR